MRSPSALTDEGLETLITVTHPEIEKVAPDFDAIACKNEPTQRLADLVADPTVFSDSEIKGLLTTMLNQRSHMSWRVSSVSLAHISLD